MNLKISLKNPTVEEYNELRRLAGWPTFAAHQASIGLSNSMFSVIVHTDGNQIMGMGRIVGDGAIYFHIQDVIVRPGFQRLGIGRMIMEELMRFIEQHSGKNANIGLMCSKGREAFYRQFGFIERPNEKFGAGMIRINE